MEDRELTRVVPAYRFYGYTYCVMCAQRMAEQNRGSIPTGMREVDLSRDQGYQTVCRQCGVVIVEARNG